MEPKFVPSLVGMDLMNVQSQIEKLNRHAYHYHVDIIDWHFAGNMMLSPMFVEQLRKITDVPIEVHLMVEGLPFDIIEAVAEAGADTVSLHAEDARKNIYKYSSYLHGMGKKLGIVLNPATPLEEMQEYIDQVDLITFMGVTPGFVKQALVVPVLDKISRAVRLRAEHGYSFETQIDGGCHRETMKRVADSGVDMIIMGGTCLFGHSPDMDEAWSRMESDYREWTKQVEE